MSLHPDNQALVLQADRVAIAAEYKRLVNNWKGLRWLGARNRYRRDATERIKSDHKRGAVHKSSELREYIAASAVVHCFDGWTYLGRSVDCRLKGDPATACHLAYYAELRAAMSLLASEGIGVFGKRHFIVAKNGRCVEFPVQQQTHQFVWDVVEYWAGTAAAQTLLLEVVVPGGVSLNEWLNAFSAGGGFTSALATKWLKEWAADLQRFSDDRRARNTASYRPTSFFMASIPTVLEALDSVDDLWTIHEPHSSFTFASVDRLLLKYSVELYFQQAQGRRPKQARSKYKTAVIAMLSHISPKHGTDWERYLLDFEAGSNLLIDAQGHAELYSPDYSAQICARASLLLRLATGAARSLLKGIPADRNDLHFWWDRAGQDRCLWDAGDEPNPMSDLWVDIQDALTDVRDWRTRIAGAAASYNKLWTQNGSAASRLGSFERIALWSLDV